MAQLPDNTLWRMLNDLSTKKGISEISINGPRSVFVERDGKFIQLNVDLAPKDIYEFIQDVAKRNRKVCDQNTPILDGLLPDGSRINVITSPFVQGYPAISIRKYIKGIKSFHSIPGVFGLYEKWIQFFKAMVSARMNIIVSGGTGVGKTTFLNLLLNEINPTERVITIEDTIELSVQLPNLVRLESGHKPLSSATTISARELVKNSLRMRPDRIILGEVRGGELFDLLMAMNTGHDGSMCSVHASSTVECLGRLETLFLLAGFEVPLKAIRRQIATGVDYIVQVSRLRDGRRVVTEISEVTGMEGDNILTSRIASFDDEGLHSQGITPSKIDRLHTDGGLPRDFFNE